MRQSEHQHQQPTGSYSSWNSSFRSPPGMHWKAHRHVCELLFTCMRAQCKNVLLPSLRALEQIRPVCCVGHLRARLGLSLEFTQQSIFLCIHSRAVSTALIMALSIRSFSTASASARSVVAPVRVAPAQVALRRPLRQPLRALEIDLSDTDTQIALAGVVLVSRWQPLAAAKGAETPCPQQAHHI
jgi:hypothetical protein